MTFPRAAIKRYARVVGGSTPSPDPRNWDGNVNWLSPTDVSRWHGNTVAESQRKLTAIGLESCAAAISPAGSVVVTTRAPVGNVAITDRPSATNQGCRTLVPGNRLDGRFLRYQLQVRVLDLRRMSVGSTFLELSGSALGCVSVSVPPLATQVSIADFLDGESARTAAVTAELTSFASATDALAAADAERLLLTAQSRSPRRRLSWEMTITGGFAFQSETFVHEKERGTRLLRGINVRASGTHWEDVVYWPHARTREAARFKLRTGDLVIGLNRPWISGGLRCAIIEPGDLPALLLQRVACLRPRQDSSVDARYVQLWLQTSHFRQAVRDDAAVTFPMLDPGRLMSYRIPVPSSNEQRQIVAACQANAERASAVRLEAQLTIEGLAEYRDALITEAVTGRLDVTRLSEAQLDESLNAVREGEAPEVLTS